MVKTLGEWCAAIFSAEGFVPRRICGRWPDWLIWEHVVGNALVWLAYVAIPIVIGVVGSRRAIFAPFRSLVGAFAGFIFLCGLGHLLDMLAFVYPMYRFSGHVLIATGVASWGTVWALGRAWPTLAAMRSPAELEREVTIRTEELADANAALREGERRLRQLLGQLDEERRHLQTLIESSHDAIHELDLGGEVVSGNAAGTRFFGPAGASLSWIGLWSEGTRDAAATALARAAAGEVGTFEGFHPVPEGEAQWFDVTLTPIPGPSGQPLRLLSVARNVSDRKRLAEERERLLSVAQEANRAKDHFLAVLSHELRTPLNPILLAASALIDRAVPVAELRTTMEMIRTNVAVQARLIDNLLDVIRLGRGELSILGESVDCHAMIREALDSCRGELLGRSGRCDFHPSARLHHVQADAARLRQVFWNLIKNAVKFSPEGGEITITTRNEPAGPESDAPTQLVVEVTDAGIGITPAALGRIFEPFEQVESTSARRFGGLGLGLALCRGVVEALGGTIEAQSHGLGQGTTFRIRLDALPQRDDDIPEDLDRRRSRISGRGLPTPTRPAVLEILLVEDDPVTMRLLARLLRHQGHGVVTAATVADGLMALDEQAFDLIISDLGLPDGSGLDVVRHAARTRGHVPAIALTGYGMEEDIRRSHEAGFLVHMTKPIDFSRLEAMIHRVAPSTLTL